MSFSTGYSLCYLDVAQRGKNLLSSRGTGWKYSANATHKQRESQAGGHDERRDFEIEGSLAEGNEAAHCSGDSVQRQHQQAAQYAAQHRQQQRLQKETS